MTRPDRRLTTVAALLAVLFLAVPLTPAHAAVVISDPKSEADEVPGGDMDPFGVEFAVGSYGVGLILRAPTLKWQHVAWSTASLTLSTNVIAQDASFSDFYGGFLGLSSIVSYRAYVDYFEFRAGAGLGFTSATDMKDDDNGGSSLEALSLPLEASLLLGALDGTRFHVGLRVELPLAKSYDYETLDGYGTNEWDREDIRGRFVLPAFLFAGVAF